MNHIIVTTPEELRQMISEIVFKAIARPVIQEEHDAINMDEALQVLQKHGYPTSKSQMYKLTSSKALPCSIYGKRLVFSRKELLLWAERQTLPKQCGKEVTLQLARSANRKFRK